MLKRNLIIIGLMAMLSCIANGMNFATPTQARTQVQMFVLDEKNDKKALDMWALFIERFSRMPSQVMERITKLEVINSAGEKIQRILDEKGEADVRFTPEYFIVLYAAKNIQAFKDNKEIMQDFINAYERLQNRVNKKTLKDTKNILKKYEKIYEQQKARLKDEVNITMNEVVKQLNAMNDKIDQLRCVFEDSWKDWKKPSVKKN